MLLFVAAGVMRSEDDLLGGAFFPDDDDDDVVDPLLLDAELEVVLILKFKLGDDDHILLSFSAADLGHDFARLLLFFSPISLTLGTGHLYVGPVSSIMSSRRNDALLVRSDATDDNPDVVSVHCDRGECIQSAILVLPPFFPASDLRVKERERLFRLLLVLVLLTVDAGDLGQGKPSDFVMTCLLLPMDRSILVKVATVSGAMKRRATGSLSAMQLAHGKTFVWFRLSYSCWVVLRVDI